MCFSASASFGAGIVLSTIGVASLKKTSSSSQIPFASIPLIFAIQQITEGFLWLSLAEPVNSVLHASTTYLFLFFAQVVWPFWVPYSVLKIERNEKRKKTLRILVGIGTIVSFYLAYCLVKFPVQSGIMEHHISYRQDYPEQLSRFGGVFYVMSTILPPILSSAKRMILLGLAIFISYVVTYIFYEDYIVSVWCFFASVISIAVYAVIRELKIPGRPLPIYTQAGK